MNNLHHDLRDYLKSKGHQVLDEAIIISLPGTHNSITYLNIGRYAIDKYREEMSKVFPSVKEHTKVREYLKSLIEFDNIKEIYYRDINKLDDFLFEVILEFLNKNISKYNYYHEHDEIRIVFHSDIDGWVGENGYAPHPGKEFKKILPKEDAIEYAFIL